MSGLYSHTTRADGTVLTAAIYNADHQNHITNFIPSQMDDYSNDATEMKTQTTPGIVGSESFAQSMAGEIERIRYAVAGHAGTANWYECRTVAQYGSLSALVSHIGASVVTLRLYPEAWPVAADLTIPSNITFECPRGVDFQVASGQTLVIQGWLDAGGYTVFSGDGMVDMSGALNPKVDVRWWGVTPGTGGIPDATTKLQAAITSANGERVVDLGYTGSTLGYQVSNLTTPKGTVLRGGGSHRCLIERIAGSTGPAITDNGNPNKTILEGFAVLGSGTTGDGIDYIGDASSNVFGAEAWMSDVFVTNFVGIGVKVHANAATMENVRSTICTTGFHIQGSVLLGNRLIASNCTTNFLIIGTAHKISDVYSESATTSHVQFGDGTTQTQRCQIDGIACHLKSSATTPQVVLQKAVGSNEQLNQIKSGSINFQTASVLTYLVNDEAEGITYPYQETTNTNLGFWEWTPDRRSNITVLHLDVAADFPYTLAPFAAYTDILIEGVAGASVALALPETSKAYGRTIRVYNKSARNVNVTENAADTNSIFTTTTTTASSIGINTGETVILTCGTDGWPTTKWYTLRNNVNSSGVTGGVGSAGAGNQYVEQTINGTTYKTLYDGTA